MEYFSQQQAEKLVAFFQTIEGINCKNASNEDVLVGKSWISPAGVEIKVSNGVQRGYYVTVSLSNGQALSPIEFAGANRQYLSQEFKAQHEAI